MIILWLLNSDITMLILTKDDMEFVTELPCLLGHPVSSFFERRDWFCPFPCFSLLLKSAKLTKKIINFQIENQLNRHFIAQPWFYREPL